jgi:hypothetical protein
MAEPKDFVCTRASAKSAEHCDGYLLASCGICSQDVFLPRSALAAISAGELRIVCSVCLVKTLLDSDRPLTAEQRASAEKFIRDES